MNESGSGVVINVSMQGLPSAHQPFLVEYFPSVQQIEQEEILRKNDLEQAKRIAEKALRDEVFIKEPMISTLWVGRGKKRRESRESLWWKQEGVCGVNIAYRTKFGRTVSPLQLCIQVDVRRKFSKVRLKELEREAFPSYVEVSYYKRTYAVPVKLREIEFVPAIANGLRTSGLETGGARSDAILGGIQIAPSTSTGEWGTLAICINAGELIGITNSHVAKAINTSIQNPAGNQPPDAVFATVIESKITRFVDSAALKKVGPREFKEGIIDSGLNPVQIKYYSKAVLEDHFTDIRKIGAATGSLPAFVHRRQFKMTVPEISPNRFEDIIELKSLVHNVVTDQGDSGGPVVGRNSQGEWVVFGLNFAMSVDRKFAYAIPFGQVLKSTNILSKISSSRLWP